MEQKKSERDRGPASGTVDVSRIKNAVPKKEPKSKYGNPESYVVFGKRYYVMDDSKGFSQKGIASWYGEKFHGRRTSSGEPYDMYGMTAAHKSLPLPTYVEVKNIKNGKTIIVKVNDRGPFHENRIIDLSYSAAEKLDIVRTGTGLVEIFAIDPGRRNSRTRQAAKVDEKTKAPVYSAPVYSQQHDAFYIQVGSFSNPDNAEKLRSKLGGIAGKPVRVSETNISNRTLYRVRIGPIENIDVADGIVSKLGDFGVTEHRIVVD